MKQKALDGFIREMTKMLRSGKDFAMAQAPDVLQQVVRLEIAHCLYHIVLGVLLLVLAGVTAFHWAPQASGGADGGQGFVIFLSIFPAGAGLLFTGVAAYALLKVWVAPKVFLLEYFARLVRGDNNNG